MSYGERGAWVAQSIDTRSPVRPRKITAHLKERKVTRVFYLSTEERTKIRVCQKMFLATLGLKCDKIIETAIGKTSLSQLKPYSDKRGCQEPANKKTEDVVNCVKAHIKKFNPSISHYRCKHAPNRLYISPEFTITSMYNDFCETNKEIAVSYSFYHSQIKAMNISFTKLGEEECEVCDVHDHHLQDFHRLCKQDVIAADYHPTFDACKICNKFKKHITKAKEARDAYKSEKERIWEVNEIVFSVDMQKV